MNSEKKNQILVGGLVLFSFVFGLVIVPQGIENIQNQQITEPELSFEVEDMEDDDRRVNVHVTDVEEPVYVSRLYIFDEPDARPVYINQSTKLSFVQNHPKVSIDVYQDNRVITYHLDIGCTSENQGCNMTVEHKSIDENKEYAGKGGRYYAGDFHAS